MEAYRIHSEKIHQLQEQLRFQRSQGQASHITLQYGSGHSNTTRSKSYKKNCYKLHCGMLNTIIEIDPIKRIVKVEPRVTMEALVQATLAYGLMPPIVPEFKGITVGGAIMGGAAESTSHKWGIFNDTCTSFEILCGDGNLLRATPTENPDIFFGIPGSYGSLGALVMAEIKLIPAKKFVHLHYHRFSNPLDALDALQSLSHSDFLDGIVFSKDLAVVVVGTLQDAPSAKKTSSSPLSPWFYQHVKETKVFEETVPIKDYLFRYDQGAFWMGSYLFKFPLLAKFLGQGVFNFSKPACDYFDEKEILKFHNPPVPNAFWRALSYPLMKSQGLWALLHKAEKWVQDRFIIQDLCIPESHARPFFEEVLEKPGIFPLWLCPIKGTHSPQIFSPHLLSKDSPTSHFINFGLYGLPSYSAPIVEITRALEKKTDAYRGRKVLYSRSFYPEEEFWKIYPQIAYETLREKTHAKGIWQGITEKVLSE